MGDFHELLLSLADEMKNRNKDKAFHPSYLWGLKQHPDGTWCVFDGSYAMDLASNHWNGKKPVDAVRKALKAIRAGG